jgi:predicted nucleic acid-binding protein
MIVAFDASVLVYLLDDTSAAPQDDDGMPISDCQARVSHLIAELQRAKAKIIVPAPALAEVLVYGGSASATWLSILNTSRHIRVSPFDERAAVEYAAMELERLSSRRTNVPRAKAKFDQQIVAIARIEGAELIYSDDHDIRRLWRAEDQVIGIAALPLPPQDAQLSIEFDPDVNDDEVVGNSSDESK